MIGGDRRPVEPIERYLAWLTSIERSPNTLRAYAQDLKTLWVFLERRGLRWDELTLEQVGQFTAWLRQPADNVIVLESGKPRRSARTVNRMLAALFGFYEFHARHGVPMARALLDASRSGRGGYKPFLHGIAHSQPRGRVGRLRDQRRLPRALSLEEVAAVIAAQRRLRDRFLFALLFGTGMRVGQALGLRPRGRRLARAAGRARPARGQRKRRPRQARRRLGADHRRARPAALRRHARGVRGARLRLRVREPLGRANRPADELSERDRCGAAHAHGGSASISRRTSFATPTRRSRGAAGFRSRC